MIANYASFHMPGETWSGKKYDVPLSVYARPNESQGEEIAFGLMALTCSCDAMNVTQLLVIEVLPAIAGKRQSAIDN